MTSGEYGVEIDSDHQLMFVLCTQCGPAHGDLPVHLLRVGAPRVVRHASAPSPGQDRPARAPLSPLLQLPAGSVFNNHFCYHRDTSGAEAAATCLLSGALRLRPA